MTNRFVNGALNVQFNTPPLRGTGESLRKRQRSAHDSNGARYVSDKHPARDEKRRLQFPRVPAATLAELLIFRGASLDTFTWYDHLGVSRVISFSGEVTYTPAQPGYYRIDIPIEGQI